VKLNFTGFEQQLTIDQKKIVAKIYDGESHPPEGFNVIRISLDVSDRSLLNWKEAICYAQSVIEKGLLVLWELVFDLQKGSLDDEARFLTFQLNIQHFNEVVWEKFQKHTFGVALFRGKLQEGIADYLKSLAALLADEVACFIFLDTTEVFDLETYFQLIDKEIFNHINLILKGPFSERYPWAVPAFGWDHGFSALGFCSRVILTHLSQKRLKYALCLPKQAHWDQVREVITILGQTPFRVIPENLLTHEWEGIETLIIFPQQMTHQSWRKIHGFTAAGGEIIRFPDDVALLPLQETSQLSSPAFLQ